MSSHHIVREKQEPALLIMSLEGFDPENLGQLLEWSPTVIVHEDVYELADSMALKVDIVVGRESRSDLQENTRIIHADAEPLEDALKFLVGEKYPAVNVIAGNFILKDYAWCVDDINLVIFSGDRKIFPVKSGFSKWRPAGETIEIMHDVHHLAISGLKPLTSQVFETEKDGFYSLSFDQPFIFISEKI